MFLPEFHADLSRYKEVRVHCTGDKKSHRFSEILALRAKGAQNGGETVSPPFCAPLALSAKIFTFAL